MKLSAFAFVILLIGPEVISTATANDRCTNNACNANRTMGTAFEIAQQYSKGGKFGGVTSGNTGTALDVARDSVNFLGTLDQVASIWRLPPALAKGE